MAHAEAASHDGIDPGPVNYIFKAFAGTYDVFLDAGPSYEQSVLPNNQYSRLLQGCSN